MMYYSLTVLRVYWAQLGSYLLGFLMQLQVVAGAGVICRLNCAGHP